MSEKDWELTVESALERVERMSYLELLKAAGHWQIGQLENIQLSIATDMAVDFINTGEWR